MNPRKTTRLSIVLILLSLLWLTACMPIAPATPAAPSGTVPDATPTPAAPTEMATATPLATAGETPTDLTSDLTTDLTGTTWQLVAFGPPTATLPVIPESIVTVEFNTDGEIGGSGGCNTYGGQYEIEGDRLTVGELISTLRACLDEGITEQEMGYLEALQLADRVEVTAETLTIEYGEGSGVLTFVPATAVAP